MRPILSLVAAFLLSAQAALAAGGAEVRDLRLSALRQAPDAQVLTPAAIADGPGAILAAIAGVDVLPVPCATTLLQGAELAAPGSALRQALTLLSASPARPDDRAVASRDGRFILRVPATGGLRLPAPGPEFVARVSEALVASRAYLTGTLGYPDPAPGTERITVVLVPLGHGLEGYIVSGRGARPSGAVIVLDAGLAADRVMPAVLHQMAHLAQPAAPGATIGWSETVASFLTLTGTGDLDAQRDAIAAWLAEPARGFEDDSLLRMQGGLVWPLFLAERTGDPDVVRQVGAEMAAGDRDPAAAVDVVLRRSYGLSRPAALREMAVWNLLTGSRDDARHYAGGAAMPEAALVAVGPGLPLALGPVEPVAPGGSVAFRLLPDGGRGSLDIAIEADGGRPAADLLAFYPGGDPALVPVDLGTGRGRATIPWSEARELWIVLRNDAGGGEAPARFEVSLDRDAFAPFDLASFTASAFGRSVTLEWVTATEKGLLGWNVLRAAKPEGPFTRLNAVALPAWGDGAADTGYVFVDDSARPGQRYYYMVEGLTAAGLIERSHTASARVAGR